MQVMTRTEREINRCGDYETDYTLYDFNGIPDDQFKSAVIAFFREADSEEIWDFNEDVFTDSDPTFSKDWDKEKKEWV